MAPSRDGRTYRIRQLPCHVDRLQAIDLLVSLSENLGPRDNINIRSLAPNLDPWERPRTKIATVTFKKLPPPFDSDKTEWVFKTQTYGLQRNIIVDVHFLGFTPLNDVSDSQHTVE